MFWYDLYFKKIKLVRVQKIDQEKGEGCGQEDDVKSERSLLIEFNKIVVIKLFKRG